MHLKDNEQEALFELKNEIQSRYELLDYRLYGSRAKGHDLPDSDIDVMIELEKTSPEIELDIDKLVFSINLEHDCFISVVLFNRSELEEGPLDQSPLYRAIQREGIAL